jgi:RNase P subunit RPR2
LPKDGWSVNRRRRAANARNREEATAIARNLIQLALSTAGTDLDLAKEQAALARRIMLKFNIRYSWYLRRFYCHGCKGLMLPGLNARVRLGPSKLLLVTCQDCGHVNRKRLRQA